MILSSEKLGSRLCFQNGNCAATHWHVGVRRANTRRLKMQAAMPGSAAAQEAAAAELAVAALSESEAVACATAARKKTLRDFLRSRRRAAAAELGASVVGRCKLTPPDPQLKGAWYPGGFNPCTDQV